MESIVAPVLEYLAKFHRSFPETGIVLFLHRTPTRLCHSEHTWINHVLQMVGLRDELSPHITLDTKQMRAGNVSGIRVCEFKRNVTADGLRLINRSILRIIEIVERVRRHDDIVSCLDCRQTIFHSAPGHDHGIVA